MPARKALQLRNSQGQLIALGRLLKSGGEGAVHEVQGHKDLVAKIYHKDINQSKAEKLSAMVSLRTERLLKLSAWPIETLHDGSEPKPRGFLMPRIFNHTEIHVLYGVKSRLVEFPDACWPFLIHTAMNIARAFAEVHDHGHVIGDVNFGGVVVAHDATVRLVDCDSFQITAQGRRFPCEVGFPDFTPPELHGQTLGSVVRTPNHDAFGLAIIIFQLLFMGRHPFAGRYLGSRETPSLQDLIRDYRFAYGPNAQSRNMSQPPGTLNLEDVSPSIARLFEQAFSRVASRPTPKEWVLALGNLSKGLSQCRVNSGHYFINTRLSCPWCELEAVSTFAYFNIVIPGVAGSQYAFSITGIWAQLEAIPPLGPPPALPTRALLNLVPSAEVARQVRRARLWSLGSISIIVVAVVVVFVGNLNIANAYSLVILSGIFSVAIARRKTRHNTPDLKANCQQAEKEWREVEQRWRVATNDSRIDTTLREFEKKKSEYVALPDEKRRKLQQLEANARDRQKYNFLNQIRIDKASISGIGSGRKAMLRSYGIETAADVNKRAILSVPGFGATYTAKLLGWRQFVEQSFIYRPTLGIDPADRAAIEREFTARRLRLEQELRNAPSQLRQISQQVRTARSVLGPIAEKSFTKLVQAQTDASARRSPTLSVAPALASLGVILLIVLPLRYRDVLAAYQGSSSQPNEPYNKRMSENSKLNSGTTAPSDSPKERAQTLYERGVSLTRTGQYDDASKLYRQAVLLNPDMAEAYHELGYASYKSKRYKESIEASKRAIALAPNNAETFRNLAAAYTMQAHWSDAVRSLLKASELEPNHPITRYNLGLAYKEMRDDSSARDAFKEAVRLKPDYAVAHYELGLAYLATGDTTSALDEYSVLSTLNMKLANQLYEQIAQ